MNYYLYENILLYILSQLLVGNVHWQHFVLVQEMLYSYTATKSCRAEVGGWLGIQNRFNTAGKKFMSHLMNQVDIITQPQLSFTRGFELP